MFFYTLTLNIIITFTMFPGEPDRAKAAVLIRPNLLAFTLVLTLVLITRLNFWRTQNRICFWKINLKNVFDKKTWKTLTTSWCFCLDAFLALLFKVLARPTRHFSPFAKGWHQVHDQTLPVQLALSVKWQLFVLGTIARYRVEHLSLACAVCWTSRGHKPSILAQLVPFTLPLKRSLYIIIALLNKGWTLIYLVNSILPKKN